MDNNELSSDDLSEIDAEQRRKFDAWYDQLSPSTQEFMLREYAWVAFYEGFANGLTKAIEIQENSR